MSRSRIKYIERERVEWRLRRKCSGPDTSSTYLLVPTSTVSRNRGYQLLVKLQVQRSYKGTSFWRMCSERQQHTQLSINLKKAKIICRPTRFSVCVLTHTIYCRDILRTICKKLYYTSLLRFLLSSRVYNHSDGYVTHCIKILM